MPTFPYLRESPHGCLIDVYVQPKASRNELVGLHEGSLKLRLTAPPVEGEANKACVALVAKVLRVPKSQVEIMQGHRSRRKTVLVHGISVEQVQGALGSHGIN